MRSCGQGVALGSRLHYAPEPRGVPLLATLILGFLFGFVGSIPVAGPISALVLRKSLQGNHRAAALVGFGGAVAESAYACLALWGFSTFLDRYPIIDPVSRALAGIVLIALGVSFMRYRNLQEAKSEPAKSTTAAHFLAGFAITLLNPTLIATWTASAATLTASGISFDASHAPLFGLGSFFGVAGWFLLFVKLLRRYGSRFNPGTLVRVVRVIGFLVLLLGIWFAYRFIQYWL